LLLLAQSGAHPLLRFQRFQLDVFQVLDDAKHLIQQLDLTVKVFRLAELGLQPREFRVVFRLAPGSALARLQVIGEGPKGILKCLKLALDQRSHVFGGLLDGDGCRGDGRDGGVDDPA